MSTAEQVEAALFSAMTFFESRMVDKGTKVLLDIHEALNHARKSGIPDDDRSKYDDLLIFAYRADARNRQLQTFVREEDHAGQYRIHDKLGDLYFSADFKEAALYHYEQALKLAEAQAENENARKAMKKLHIDAMKSNTEEESDDDEKSEKGYDSLDEMKEDHIRNIMLKKAKDNAKKKALAILYFQKNQFQKNQYGESILIECAREGNLADVKILVEQGADVMHTDAAGWTPLSEAVGANNLEIVKYLLTKGADPNSKSNENGRWVDLPYHGHITPLMEACTNGFHEIAQWLLHHKAATSLVISTNLDGWTAADFMSDYIKRAVREGESEEEFQHNLYACREVLENIKQLQRESGFPVRIGDPPAILPNQ